MFNSMIDNLYQEALIRPILNGARELSIVTGYSSPGIVHKLFKDVREMHLDIKVDLTIGMTSGDLINYINHQDFLKLQATGKFLCRYITTPPLVHAKLYLWESLEHENIMEAYTGSANFSLNGLINGQVEVLTSVDKNNAKSFVEQIKARATPIDQVLIPAREAPAIARVGEGIIENNTITLTLLDSRNAEQTPARSGINWGQRERRNPDQSYINIPASINRQHFFPEIGIPFIIQTDDNQTLAVVRAQDGGKGLETYESNALLGRYLRERLGVASGTYVMKEDLERYGRTDVTIIKLDDETYYLDFSV